MVVLFFGYIFCPDVCPTTMGELALVMKELGKDAERVQVLFITVDPERDTPDLLSKYVPNFHPSFLESLLSCIPPVLHPTFPEFHLSSIPHVQHLSCSASLMS